MAAQNSAETAERVIGRPFPKGVSGNPGGRPRGLARVVREELGDGQELVSFMVDVLRDPRAERRERLEAALWLGRSYGTGGELREHPTRARARRSVSE